MKEEIVEVVEALIDMVVVMVRGKLGAEDGGVKFLIRREGGLCMFQVPLRDPGVFFGRVSFASDQEGTGCRGSAVADNLFNFVFFFAVDKVKWWRREVPAVDLVFTIRR